ncbi:hypothetical protein OEZ85_006826 [Tetradesmus obliquus]|uniref:Uncharacterized protein n=1 Tax=Tetradesmus obliquus TaxID=3088 RepID=A0ABY8TYA8_TETOB|nr:hypothetical protein OEZ85_006826 [Tetradesmus obliquus]
MISAGLPLASRPHAPGRSNRAITSAKPAIRAISGRSRKLLTATPPPAVARPANGHRLLSLASQDANRGSESASIDDNVLASILSAAAVVKNAISSRAGKVRFVNRPSNGLGGNGSEDQFSSLEGSLASLASLLAPTSPDPSLDPLAKPLKVTAKAVGAGTTDDFCPNAWEAAAAAAAAAAMDEASTAAAAVGELTAADAAAAVAQDGTFDPRAWEMAAAAAAQAAASERTAFDGSAGSSSSGSGTAQQDGQAYATSAICWAVELLSQALAAAAGFRHTTGLTPQTPVSVPQLLLLPSNKAAAELLQLSPAQRAGTLLLLCGGEGGSRGDAWLGNVLSDVQHRLGLLEMGVALAAVYHRRGRPSFLSAAKHLLPLNEPSDPYLTASLGAMQPAGVLQALLLHWLLLPQLALAGLPALPEALLPQLLPEVVAALSSRQLQLAARWSEVWRITLLQQPAAAAILWMHCRTPPTSPPCSSNCCPASSPGTPHVPQQQQQ